MAHWAQLAASLTSLPGTWRAQFSGTMPGFPISPGPVFPQPLLHWPASNLLLSYKQHDPACAGWWRGDSGRCQGFSLRFGTGRNGRKGQRQEPPQLAFFQPGVNARPPSCSCNTLHGPPPKGSQEGITFKTSVRLNDELPRFLAEQHCVPEGKEGLRGSIRDRRIALIEGPASGHIPCGLQHLWEGRGVSASDGHPACISPRGFARGHS